MNKHDVTITRYFYFWCERCSTRITVETEVPADAPDGDPQYGFAMADGVGVVVSRDHVSVALNCPACEGQLHDLDEMLARGNVPYHDSRESSMLHTAWRKEIVDGS